MYLRTVFRSKPVVRAIADTDRPCRCRSSITTNSPRLITENPLPTIGMSIGEDAPPVFQGAPRKTGTRSDWGRFKRHFWGVLRRHRQQPADYLGLGWECQGSSSRIR